MTLSKFQKYEMYKSSCIEWLPEIRSIGAFLA